MLIASIAVAFASALPSTASTSAFVAKSANLTPPSATVPSAFAITTSPVVAPVNLASNPLMSVLGKVIS